MDQGHEPRSVRSRLIFVTAVGRPWSAGPQPLQKRSARNGAGSNLGGSPAISCTSSRAVPGAVLSLAIWCPVASHTSPRPRGDLPLSEVDGPHRMRVGGGKHHRIPLGANHRQPDAQHRPERHGLRGPQPPGIAVRTPVPDPVPLEHGDLRAPSSQFHGTGHANHSPADDSNVELHAPILRPLSCGARCGAARRPREPEPESCRQSAVCPLPSGLPEHILAVST
jgi:hypothetical protein